MQVDASTAPDGTTFSADVCIVGAGPAGLTLADALQSAGRSVIVIESGGPVVSDLVQQLNDGDMAGDPYDGVRATRSRGIGGTPWIWSIRIAGAAFAKYVPLDHCDFAAREWIPWSGWPFDRATLDPFYRRAQGVCGLGDADYSAAGWKGLAYTLLEFPDRGLSNANYQFGPATRFTEFLPARLNASASVTLVHSATVTDLVRSSGGDRFTEARWTTLEGRRGVAQATTFVLAAGAIENARLLLLNRRARPAPPSQGDWLGRGFMEHPVDHSVQLTHMAPGLSATSGFYSRHQPEGMGMMLGRIALGEDLLREERLPNASLRLAEIEPFSLLRSGGVTPGPLRRVIPQALRRKIGGAIRSVTALPGKLRPRREQVQIDLEQVPHPDNRITLSDTVDAFGQPRVRLHWRWREQDQANRERVLATVVRELARARVGRLSLAARVPINPNAHHHAGTTRMHDDPALGVVDANLRVHGEENLFVTGASVFPTAGFANPTLTIIALTLRLADTLSQRQRTPVTA